MTRIAMLVSACLLALASEAGDGTDDGELPLWELRGVLFAQSFPTYPGADDQNVTVLPLPYPVYRGRILRLGEDLDQWAEGRFIRSERLNLSVSFDATFPEDSDDIEVRKGMPDLDFLAEVGPELELRLAGDPDDGRELRLALPLRAVLSFDGFDPSGRGFVFSPELEYEVRRAFGSRNTVSLRWSPAWASENYADYFYEVAPEFTTAARSAYDASGGYIGSELKVGVERQLSERWRFIGSARLWVNQGAQNEDSPLFRRDYGSGVRVALIYTFVTSKRRVSD